MAISSDNMIQIVAIHYNNVLLIVIRKTDEQFWGFTSCIPGSPVSKINLLKDMLRSPFSS